jgi:thiol:disulfide interchange protein
MAVFLFWRVGEDADPWKVLVGVGVAVILAGLVLLAVVGGLNAATLDLGSVPVVLSLVLFGVGILAVVGGIGLKWRDRAEDSNPTSPG